MVRRKDNKGRVLNDGEIQRSDGRYAYQYTDASGTRRTAYSWKLLPSDRVPAGKRKDISLREKEKQIKDDLNRGIVPCGGGMTVLELVERYLSQKRGIRHNTEANYRFIFNIIKKEEFGTRRIDRVKLSDAKAWIAGLQSEGRGYSTIHLLRSVVKMAFQMAVEDDLLLKNPFDFRLATVIVNDSVARESLTWDQEQKFLDFVKNDEYFCRYYDGIYILFHTGLRISEFAGLTISDIDFKNQKVIVDHQLQRKRNMEYVIEDTKTSCGIREIPMMDGVCECFRRIIQDRKAPAVEPLIGGKSGFLYLSQRGMPRVAAHWDTYFQHIMKKYNETHRVQMPRVTPHVCRHTFCSNMAKSGMNPKILQYIMGHSDIGMTLNTYTHVNFDSAQKEIERLGLGEAIGIGR